MENNYDLPSGDRIWELASEAKAGRDKERRQIQTEKKGHEWPSKEEANEITK